MIRSIHAIGSPRLGGAEKFFARLVNALTQSGNPATAVLRRGSMIGGILDEGVARVPTPMLNSLDVATLWTIRRLIAREKPEIIQTYLGRASRLTRVPRRSPTIHVARLGGYYNPRSYRHADAWVANTLGIRDYLVAEGFPAERVFHVSNFVEERRVGPASAAAAREGAGVPAKALLLFALGRFRPSKGFVDLLDAFAMLPKEAEGRPLYLAVAGDGELKDELRAHAERLGIAERVRWTGWLTDPDPLYAAADVFVCPSRIEHLGNVILEAWARGAPVVSTRTRGAVELVEEGATGVLVDTSDARAMSEGIRQAIEMGEAGRRALSEAGTRVVRTRHSREAIVAAYLDLYQRLKGMGRRR